MEARRGTTTVETGAIDDQDLKAAEQLAEIYEKLTQELSRVIVGQTERAFYSPEGIAKFDTLVERGLAERVYGPPDNANVTIYRLQRPETAMR